jgi:hypothetical protein
MAVGEGAEFGERYGILTARRVNRIDAHREIPGPHRFLSGWGNRLAWRKQSVTCPESAAE